MRNGSICEPVSVDPALLARAERVETAPSDPAPDRFAHFHDAVELVWFRRVEGELISEDGVFGLGPGTAVAIPSMRRHDFQIDPGAHAWALVHLDPTILSGVMQRDSLPALGRCFAVAFAGPARDRIEGLFAWLEELAAAGPDQRSTTLRVAELILSQMGRAAPEAPVAGRLAVDRLDRLRPALDLVAVQPAGPVSLDEAAAACHLSNAYFSRRFKLVFGMNFSDYVRSYRLRLAAQRLLSGGARISDIAYEAGFATAAHFTALFQKRFGVSPRTYRLQGRARQSANSRN